MKRWLDTGVDGFRLDAIPYLCEREGTNNENLPETHAIIKHIRAELDAYAKGKVLLAEANQWPEDVQFYFGDGDECHMAYHFPLMPRIYMAIAQEDRFPITDILRQTPDIPDSCQWAMFLRNHDELTLEMVTDIERDYLWSTYATRSARAHQSRHPPPPCAADGQRPAQDRADELAVDVASRARRSSTTATKSAWATTSISATATACARRCNGLRTATADFLAADPARLYAPPIMDPVYGYEAVNVEAQSRSLSSLLSWTKRLISVRKSSTAFGRGTMAFIRPANRSVLAYVRQYRRRGHPLRRQLVALGAGDRTRPVRIEGPHSRWRCSAARVSRRSANCLT